MLNSLCGAACDGLDEKEIARFKKVSVSLGISDDTQQEIMDTIELECKLRKKYLKLELHQN